MHAPTNICIYSCNIIGGTNERMNGHGKDWYIDTRYERAHFQVKKEISQSFGLVYSLAVTFTKSFISLKDDFNLIGKF